MLSAIFPTEPKLVSTNDVRIVLSHLRRSKRRENTFTARRNYALIIFLIGTGLRLGELERLTWSYVDFVENLIRINESKARRQKSVPLSESLARELLDWRLYLDRKFDKVPSSLFVTEKGTSFSRDGTPKMTSCEDQENTEKTDLETLLQKAEAVNSYKANSEKEYVSNLRIESVHAPSLNWKDKQWLLSALHIHQPTSNWIPKLEAMLT